MLRMAVLWVFVTCLTVHAQPAPAVAELVADASAVKPGQEFTVGVLITMRPKWHVYWKYPGEAGLPTAVRFAAPGVSFSDVRWPTPTSFDQGEGNPGFGYTDKVLLTAKAKVGADAKVGQTISVTADAQWLCCKTECLPGSKKMTLKLLVADDSVRTYQKLFDEWEKRLPVKGDARAPKLNSVIDDRTVSVTLPAGVELYPAPPGGVTLSKLRAAKGQMQFAVRSDDQPATIPAVVVTGGKGYEVELRIK
jgi:DsbC/DsbD-like thiol-disulfide interchange protein